MAGSVEGPKPRVPFPVEGTERVRVTRTRDRTMSVHLPNGVNKGQEGEGEVYSWSEVLRKLGKVHVEACGSTGVPNGSTCSDSH